MPRMDSISALLAFVRTAEAGSIVGAARVLGLSASAVGKRIARLEQELGTRLFQRTTRRVHLLSLIHISEPTRRTERSRMPSSA